MSHVGAILRRRRATGQAADVVNPTALSCNNPAHF